MTDKASSLEAWEPTPGSAADANETNLERISQPVTNPADVRRVLGHRGYDEGEDETENETEAH